MSRSAGDGGVLSGWNLNCTDPDLQTDYITYKFLFGEDFCLEVKVNFELEFFHFPAQLISILSINIICYEFYLQLKRN